MKLSTKGRYAMIALTDLALHGPDELVALSGVAERQDISLAYLEQLFVKLRRAEVVDSVRGPGGGYILAAPPAQINIAQIISAAEDKLDATQCSSKANCHHGAPCLTHDLWENLNKTINDYLSSVTLQSIIEQKNSDDGSHVIQFTHIH